MQDVKQGVAVVDPSRHGGSRAREPENHRALCGARRWRERGSQPGGDPRAQIRIPLAQPGQGLAQERDHTLVQGSGRQLGSVDEGPSREQVVSLRPLGELDRLQAEGPYLRGLTETDQGFGDDESKLASQPGGHALLGGQGQGLPPDPDGILERKSGQRSLGRRGGHLGDLSVRASALPFPCPDSARSTAARARSSRSARP